MNKKEILEFLELPAGANDAEIAVRLEDKLTYFTRLSSNAPNDFLKKLHKGNVEKIQAIKSQMGLKQNTGQHTAPPVAHQFNPSVRPSSLSSDTAQLPQQQVPAWLIRHTEQQSTKPYSLQAGLNYAGRNQQDGPTIILDSDPYVSRLHALIEVVNSNPVRVYVGDAALAGKPSKNGVYVNGNDHRINSKIELKDGDTIQIGMTKLILKLNRENISNIVKKVEEEEYMKTVVIDIF
jgi:hypothetical protein